MLYARFFNSPLWAGLTLAGVSSALLGGALVFQYGFGMSPCVLCIYQRWPHALAIIAGFIVLALRKKPKAAALAVALTALLYLIGTGLGVYHTGVEQHWWASALEACTATIPTTATELLSQIESTQAARCDTIPWSLFGISMAGYNAIISAGMTLYCLIAAICITRKANGF